MRQLILERCVKHNAEGRVYFDFTEIVNDGNLLSKLVDEMIIHVRRLKADTIIGHGYGGTQLCGAIIARYPELHSIIVRDKPHPTQHRQLEVSRNAAKRAVIIDDAIFNGRSFRATLAACKGLPIIGAVVIYDDWRALGTRQLEQQYKLEIAALVSRREIGMSRDADWNIPASVYEACLIQKPINAFASPALIDYGFKQASHWQMKTDPVFINDEIVVTCSDQYEVIAYDIPRQCIKWSHKFSSTNRPEKGIVQSLKVYDGFLYIAAYDGGIRKLDALTGDISWVVKLDNFIHATPVIHDGFLYVNTESWNQLSASGGGHMFKLDISTGRHVWLVEHDDYPPSSVAIINGSIYTSSNNNVLKSYTLDGELNWSLALSAPIKTQVVEYRGFIFGLDIKGNLYKISHDGKLSWVMKATVSGWQAPIIIYDDLLYVWSRTGTPYIFAFDEHGRKKRCIKTRGSIAGITKVGDGLLIVSTQCHLAYIHHDYKVWETNHVLKSTLLSSTAAISPNHKQLAFSLHEGGFHVYNI